MSAGRELPALAVAVLVAFAATVALTAPGAAAAGNQPTATPSPTTPSNGTATPQPTTPADEPRNATDRNDTREAKVVKPGPDRGPRRRPSAPRVRPEVIVDNDGKSHYDTLEAALEAARPGHTIVVRPGEYNESVSVDVDNLTIVGFGTGRTVVGADSTGAVLTIANATNVTVRSMTVEGGVRVSGDGSSVTLSSLTVEEGVAIEGADLIGVRLEGLAIEGGLELGSMANGSLRDVRVLDTDVTGTGIQLRGTIADLRIARSTVGDAERGIHLTEGDYTAVSIVRNDLDGNDVALAVQDGVDAASLEVHRNSFTANAVGVRSDATGTLDAERNAWGARSGPETASNPSGDGAVVRGAVDVDPWIPAVVRLEDATAEAGVITVDLVAHTERLSGFDVVVELPDGAVDAVAVDGGAMPVEAATADGELTIAGSADEPISGPAVLATITLAGDLAGSVGDLRLDEDRSDAVDESGEPLEAAFLTADLAVGGDLETPGPTTPTPEPTPTPRTATTTPRPTPTDTPATTEPTLEPTPPEEDTSSPTTEAPPPTATEAASTGEAAWRSLPPELPAIGESVLSRLVEVLRTLV